MTTTAAAPEPTHHWSVAVATVAALATLIAHAIDSLQTWETSRAALPAGVIVLLLTLLVLFADPIVRNRLRQEPALLVPFCCGIAAEWLVTKGLGMLLGTWYSDLGRWQLAGLTLSMSVAVVLALVIAVFVAAWTTALVATVERGERAVDQLGPALQRAARRYWYVLAAQVLGYGVMLLGTAGLLALSAKAGFSPAIAVLGGLFALAWNLATATLLVQAAAADLRFGATVQAALASARRGWRTLLVPKLLQLALLGLFVWFHFRSGHDETWHWNLQVTWAGSYPTESNWYGAYRKLVEAGNCELLQTMLGAALFAVALANQMRAARLTVAQRG